MGLIKDFQYDSQWWNGVQVTYSYCLSRRVACLTPSGTSVEIPSGSGLKSVRQEFDDGDSWKQF